MTAVFTGPTGIGISGFLIQRINVTDPSATSTTTVTLNMSCSHGTVAFTGGAPAASITWTGQFSQVVTQLLNVLYHPALATNTLVSQNDVINVEYINTSGGVDIRYSVPISGLSFALPPPYTAPTTPVTGGSVTTLDATVAATNMTLSSGNLVGTYSVPSSHAAVRSSTSHTTGKLYMEFTVGSTMATYAGVAIANGAWALPGAPAVDANALGWFQDGSAQANTNSVAAGTFPTYGASNVLRVAIDFGNKLAWFAVGSGSWNAGGTANPATGVGGFDFSSLNAGPYYVGIWFKSGSGSVTANFDGTGTAFAFSAPTGFTNFDGGQSVFNLGFTTQAAVAGSPQVGGTLTATSAVNDVNAVLTYQWQSAVSTTYSNISGATNSTYVPVSGDLSKHIRVVVTATDSTLSQTVTSTSPSVTIAAAAALGAGPGFWGTTDINSSGSIVTKAAVFSAFGTKNPPRVTEFSMTDMKNICAFWYGANSDTAASTNMNLEPYFGITGGLSGGGGVTPASIVAGNSDAGIKAAIDNLVAQGFSVQAGYTGKIYARINWEQNYPGTTPGNYNSQQSNGTMVGGKAYWFNTGSNSASGGTSALATSTQGNFWAWQHLYNLISFNAAGSYSQQVGCPIYVVWNPLCINNQAMTGVPSGEGIYGYPPYMYPGDAYCDFHGVDIYTNSFFPIDGPGGGNFNTYPGYATSAATAPVLGFSRGTAVSEATWWGSYDNLYHWFDYTDASNGLQDGMPSTADPTGASSNWGWGLAKAIMFAGAFGVFSGATDPVSGSARVKKPLIIPECGIINGSDFGCGAGGGTGPFDSSTAPRPSWMGGVGASEDLNFFTYLASRIAWANANGVTVDHVVPWVCESGTIMSEAMCRSFAAAFPNL